MRRGVTRRHLLRSIGGCSFPVLVGGALSTRSNQPNSPLVAKNVATGLPDTSVDLAVTAGTASPAPNESARKWLYDDTYPAPELRVPEGDTFAAAVSNRLSRGTTVHWHGVPVPNPMDGVPHVTQDPIQPGESFSYEFEASPAGTYLYHSHVGLQSDWTLMGPLIIEEESSHVEYDYEYTAVIDDYLVEQPPDGRFPSIPAYDGLVINGKLPEAAPVFDVEEGDRVRLRVVNASGAATLRVAIAGHSMEVAYADGRPIEPVEVDSFVFGVAERFDVIVTADNPGRWAIEAAPVNGDDIGNPEPARGILRYAGSDQGVGAIRPGFTGRPLRYDDLNARESYDGITGTPDRTYDLRLSRGPVRGSWAIDRQVYPDADPLPVQAGEHVRFRMRNTSEMYHPMHLHGHFFRYKNAILDTVLVDPGETVTIDFYTDNPGDWFFHCHNDYHRMSGMARVVTYI